MIINRQSKIRLGTSLDGLIYFNNLNKKFINLLKYWDKINRYNLI